MPNFPEFVENVGTRSYAYESPALTAELPDRASVERASRLILLCDAKLRNHTKDSPLVTNCRACRPESLLQGLFDLPLELADFILDIGESGRPLSRAEFADRFAGSLSLVLVDLGCDEF